MIKKCSATSLDVELATVDVWSLRRYSLSTVPSPVLLNTSAYHGLASVKYGPPALVAVVGQHQPLVHGRAGLPRPPPPPPPPMGGGSGGTNSGSSDDAELLQQQRRRSHASASTSSTNATRSTAIDPNWDPGRSEDAGAALPLNPTSCWERPSSSALLGISQRMTAAQAAVQLLRIANHTNPLIRSEAGTPPPPKGLRPAVDHTASPSSPAGFVRETDPRVPSGLPGGAPSSHDGQSNGERGEPTRLTQQQGKLRRIKLRSEAGAELRSGSGFEMGPDASALPEQDPDGALAAPRAAASPPVPPPQELLEGLDRLALRESLEVLQPLLPRLSATQLQRCLETLAAVRHTPADPWFHDWLLASEGLLEAADATEVYGMLIAMRVLRLRPQSQKWVSGAVTALSAHLPQLDAVQSVELLGCFADMALQIPEGLRSRIFALLLPDLPQLQPRVVLDLLSSCSRLRVAPPAHVLAASYSALTPAALAVAPPAAMCRLGAVMAALRLQPPLGLLAALVSRADAVLRSAVAGADVGAECGFSRGIGAAVAEPPCPDVTVANGTVMAPEKGSGPGVHDPRSTRTLRPRRGPAIKAAQSPLIASAAATAAAEHPPPPPLSSSPLQSAGAGVPSSSMAHSPSSLTVPTPTAAPAAASAASLTLTAGQLSYLLRDLRTLQAPLPSDWGMLCGQFLVACTDSSTPVVHVLYILRSAARCGLALPPAAIRVVTARLEAGLCAATERRGHRRRRPRRQQLDGDSDMDLDLDPDPELQPPPRRRRRQHMSMSGNVATETGQRADRELVKQGALAKEWKDGAEAAAEAPLDVGGEEDDDEAEGFAKSLAATPTSACTGLSQWTPQALSVAAMALVPYASDLQPSLLCALYDNLYDTLERFDLPELTATLHALPLLAAPRPRRLRGGSGPLTARARLQHSPPPAPTPPPAALISSYLSCLLGRMHRMQPWQLSMCIFALQRLRARPEPSWMDAFLGQMYRKLTYMNEVQVASVAWVVAKMSYRPQAGWMERLLSAAGGRLSCFSPRHLCQLLWAVTAMGYQPGGAWMARWFHKAQVHFRTCDGRTLAAMAWVAASLRQRPEPEWLQELCENLARRLPYTSPRAVANTLAALTALGHRPDAAWLGAVESHVRTRLPATAAVAARGAAADVSTPASPSSSLSSAAVAAEGGCYGLQDLSGICYSLARLGYRPSDEWLDAVAVAAARLALLDPTLKAAAASDSGEAADDENDSLMVGAAAAAPSAAAAAAAHAKHIALLVLALSRHRRRPPPPAWDALLEGLYPCLPYAAPQSLAVLLAAAASLRLPPPREHAGALLLASHRRMAAFSNRGLSMVFRAFVELGIDPGSRWLVRLEDVLRERRNEVEEEQQEHQRHLLLRQDRQRPPERAREQAQQLLPGGEQEEEARGVAGEEVQDEEMERAEEEGGRAHGRRWEELRLTPGERCSILWAAATLETSVLEEPDTPAALPPRHGLRGRQPQPPQPRTQPQRHQVQSRGGWLQQPSGTAAGADGYPPPPRRWCRKPGPLQRPLRLAGLITELLPDVRAGLMTAVLEADLATSRTVVLPGDREKHWNGLGRNGGRRRSRQPRQLAAYSGQDLALLCWALGRLRLRPSGLLSELLSEVQRRLEATGSAASQAKVQGGLVASADPYGMPAEAAGAAAHGLVARELVMILWGLSSVSVWPSAAWQATAAAAALRLVQRDGMRPQDLATVLAALARWRRQPKWRLFGCRNQRQQKLLLRLGGRGLPPPERRPHRRDGAAAAALKRADRQARARLRACTAKLAEIALADSAAALLPPPSSSSLMRLQPQLQAPSSAAAAIRDGAAAICSPSGSSTSTSAQDQSEDRGYSARSLATLAWALANLGSAGRLPDPWVRAFMPVSLRVLAKLPPSYRVTMLDSLSRLGLRPGRAWLEQAEQMAMSGGLRLASSYRGLEAALRRMSGEGGA